MAFAVDGSPPRRRARAARLLRDQLMASRVCYRRGDPPAALLEREWLVTNGLGGYASGTASCAPTRRYHGYLIAALPPPHGRVLYLNHLEERARFDDDGRELVLCREAALEQLRVEGGLPPWRHRRLQKRGVP